MAIHHNSCQRSQFLLSLACIGSVAALSLVPGGSRADTGDGKTVEQIKGDKRIEVLRFLASRNESNYRKIETWRGKYHFVDRSPKRIEIAKDKKTEPQQIERRDVMAIREGIVEFALDMSSDKLWSEYQEDASKAKFLSLNGKETITPHSYHPVVAKQILTSDRLTKLRSDLQFGPLTEYPDDPHHVQQTSSRLAQQDAYRLHERISDLDMRLDPRRFYSTNNAFPVYKELSNFVLSLTGEYGAEERERVSRVLEVAKGGAPGAHEYKVTMRFFTNGPEDEKGLQTEVIRFEEQSGFLPIEQTYYAKEGGRVCQHRSWIYQRTDEVLVPKEFHITIYSFDTDRLVLDRHLQFVEGVLNEPLLESTFSTDHLGLERADRLEDKVEKRLYISDGNKLLAAEQYAIATKKHPERWFLWLNGSLLLAALTVWLGRRHLRSRKLKGSS
jgi:hypothetical protein